MPKVLRLAMVVTAAALAAVAGAAAMKLGVGKTGEPPGAAAVAIPIQAPSAEPVAPSPAPAVIDGSAAAADTARQLMLAAGTPALPEPAPTAPPSAMSRPTLPAEFWDNFRTRFVTPEGRVVDNANGSISHSEGQGYGMLLAAFAGDEETFRRLWTWTQTELLIRDDGLAAWRWEAEADPHVTDPNNATDGDILIAWALIDAAGRFNTEEYRSAAADIATGIYESVTEETAYGRILLPGAVGFRAEDRPDGPVVNLSYWVFPAFPALKDAAPELDWDSVRDAGLKLLDASRIGDSQLPSEWTALGGEKPVPAKGFEPSFSYNAIRIPLYLAWAKAGDREDLAPFMALWSGGKAEIRAVNVKTGRKLEAMGGAGYEAIAALVACAMEGQAVPEALRKPVADLYYPSALQAFALVAAQEAHSGCR